LIAVALVALAACDASPDISRITGVRQGTGGQTGGQSGGQAATETRASALVGRWSRTVIFTAEGEIQSSQTIWDFRADGTATRTVIATNHTEGIADQVVVNVSWHTTGEIVIITFIAPDSGTEQFVFGVSGSSLTLGGLTFTRIA
jgi:hypothetical protein